MVASGEGHVECVMILLDRGAQANNQNRVSTLLIRGAGVSDLCVCVCVCVCVCWALLDV